MFTSGSYRQRFEGFARQERVCILYDKRSLRADCISHATKQRLVAREMALWYQDQHHL